MLEFIPEIVIHHFLIRRDGKDHTQIVRRNGNDTRILILRGSSYTSQQQGNS